MLESLASRLLFMANKLAIVLHPDDSTQQLATKQPETPLRCNEIFVFLNLICSESTNEQLEKGLSQLRYRFSIFEFPLNLFWILKKLELYRAFEFGERVSAFIEIEF